MTSCLHKAEHEELFEATELLGVIPTEEKLYEFRRCYNCKSLIVFINYQPKLDIDMEGVVTHYRP